MRILRIILDNIWGFDTFIIFVAVINVVFFVVALNYALRLNKKLNIKVFIPSHKDDPEKFEKEIRNINEAEIVELRKKSETWYSIFVNLTAIFPLLGILGTVISLLPMVSEMTDMQTNFFEALTSTFWGLVFAILFKCIDSILSARLEENDKNVTLMLERHHLLMNEETA